MPGGRSSRTRGLKPLIWTLNQAANHTLRAVRVQPRDEVASAFTRDEVAALVEQSNRDGLLAAGERDLLSGALAFDTATAGALALPLAQVHTLGPAPTPDDVEQLAARTGVTRFPIRDGQQPTGYVHLKDTLDAPTAQRDLPLPAETIRALSDVATDMLLPDAIEIMRTSDAHTARVITAEPHADGGATTLWMITLDDIFASFTHT